MLRIKHTMDQVEAKMNGLCEGFASQLCYDPLPTAISGYKSNSGLPRGLSLVLN